jgi:peptide/nickel transport system permease protein
MINQRIKIWHLLIVLFTLIYIIRFDLIITMCEMLGLLSYLLFTDYNKIYPQINLKIIDASLAFTALFALPIIAASSRKIRKAITYPVNISRAVLILLGFCFLFAPIITKQDPDFQKNISVTKLLPPFSSVQFISLKREVNLQDDIYKNFLFLRDKAISQSFNDEIIFLDSLRVSLSSSLSSSVSLPAGKAGSGSSVKDTRIPLVKYYQNGVAKDILLVDVVSANGHPIINERLFILGTDEFGRDIFTRLIFGSRISLFVGIFSVFLSLIIGISFAFTAAQKGGIIDIILSRVTDLFLSFPAIFLVILILALFGNNLISVIIVLGLSGWMSLFKIVKTEISSVKKKDYFITASQLGLKGKKLLVKEILPVLLAPVIVNLVFQFSNVILAESALSYLGLGTGAEYPSWGAMIESGQQYITQSWWMIFIPGIALIITLISINNIGRSINKFYNPKLNV